MRAEAAPTRLRAGAGLWVHYRGSVVIAKRVARAGTKKPRRSGAFQFVCVERSNRADFLDFGEEVLQQALDAAA